jgi:hypothetical protein
MAGKWQVLGRPIRGAGLEKDVESAKTTSGNRSREWTFLAGLLVFAVLVRSGVLWTMRTNLQQDPDAYREIAENLLRHGEFALGRGEPGSAPTSYRPTAYRPPLYPVVLSSLPAAGGHEISLVKVALLHLMLGVATVWLTWLTARRYLANIAGPEGQQKIASTVRSASRSGLLNVGPPGLGTVPLLAGVIVALDPILLNQQTLVMTETLAAFLAILSLWCLVRFDAQRSWFNAGLAGAAIGLAVLCRPTFLPWLGLVGLTMLLVRSGPDLGLRIADFRWAERGQWLAHWFSGLGWRLANVAALGIVAAAVVSPWAIRNQRVFGKPIVTTTHGGYTLYLANNKSFYAYLAKGDFGVPWDVATLDAPSDVPNTEGWVVIFDLLQREGRKFEKERTLHNYTDNPELWNDRVAYVRAKWWIGEHRREFFLACQYRIAQLWSPLPHKLTVDESAGRWLLRYVTCVWYCGVYVLAAIGIWRLRWRLLQPPWIWGVLLCLAFTAVHTFYWTNMRMRAPLMPFVAMIAAAGVVAMKERQRE